jgi:S1-C subfamily serine protease
MKRGVVVVSGTSELAVRFASGAVVQADVVGTAPNYDLGVIRVRNPGQLPRPVNIGSSADLNVA